MGGVTEELGLNFLFVFDNATVNSHAWLVTTVLDMTNYYFYFLIRRLAFFQFHESVSFYFWKLPTHLTLSQRFRLEKKYKCKVTAEES